MKKVVCSIDDGAKASTQLRPEAEPIDHSELSPSRGSSSLPIASRSPSSRIQTSPSMTRVASKDLSVSFSQLMRAAASSTPTDPNTNSRIAEGATIPVESQPMSLNGCLRNSEIGGYEEIRQPFANPSQTLRRPFANLSPALCQPFLPTPLQPPLSVNPSTRLETRVNGFLEICGSRKNT